MDFLPISTHKYQAQCVYFYVDFEECIEVGMHWLQFGEEEQGEMIKVAENPDWLVQIGGNHSPVNKISKQKTNQNRKLIFKLIHNHNQEMTKIKITKIV